MSIVVEPHVVPMGRPSLQDGNEYKYVSEVLHSGVLSKGHFVLDLEREFAAKAGAHSCVAVNNGTAALIVALHALGIKPGDQVVTSAFTFNATVEAILAVGAHPWLVDIDPDTYLMNVEDAAHLAGRIFVPSTIIPVHLFGLMVDVQELYEKIPSDGRVKIIEDAAQAHGAELRGFRPGSFGDAATYSLYATKNMTAGEGGLVTFGSDERAEQREQEARRYINHGVGDQPYYHETLGFNYRLPELSAALALAQLERLDEMNEGRRIVAEVYNSELEDLVKVPFVPEGAKHVYHQYTIRLPAGYGVDRVRDKMAAEGVHTGRFYRPIYEQPYLFDLGDQVRGATGRGINRWPYTFTAALSCMQLPIYPGLTESEQEQVIDALKKALNEVAVGE